MWQEVLSCLEERERKLVNIHSGSLVFTLFCPRRSLLHQLQDEMWRKTLEDKLDELLKLLGVEAQTSIIKPDPLEPIELELLPRLHELKFTDSEKQSLGYETMTTISDTGSELLVSEQKVHDWFSRQQDVDTSEEEAMKLLDTWSLDHVEPLAPKSVCANNTFTVSESGAVGICCLEKPSLSVIYPNTDKPPLILSHDETYHSAMFVKLSGREHLAASCVNSGNLYLWDIEKRTSKKVFDLKTHARESKIGMNIFFIDDSTVGYGEIGASSDGSQRVFILNTDTEEWTLSSTIRVMIEDNSFGMCHMKMLDGTSCLLLCCPTEPSVQAVEIVGGRIRWKMDKQQQMGKKFRPWSIYTDKDNTVYVADKRQHKLHLLSPEEGAVIKSIDLRQHGIKAPFTVRCYGDYLYVEYKNNGEKYSISKFERELQ